MELELVSLFVLTSTRYMLSIVKLMNVTSIIKLNGVAVDEIKAKRNVSDLEYSLQN